MVRAAHLSLWALVAVGAAAGIAGLVFRAAPPVPTVAVSAVLAEPGVGAFAELFVAAYLTAGEGTEDILEPFLGTIPDLAGVEPAILRADHTAVADINDGGDGYWAVTVAADVVAQRDGLEHRVGIRYYSVGVAETGHALVVAGPPAQVPPPPDVEAVRLAGPGLGRPDAGDPVAAAAERFAAALLAGDGELGRYAAPGSGMRAIEPPPFAVVRLERLATTGDGTRRTARVELRAEAATGHAQVLHYELQLVQRAGRWEVTGLTGAPRLARPPALATGSTVATSTTSTAPPSTPYDPLPPSPQQQPQQQGVSVP